MELSPNARITYEKRYLIKDEKGNPTETPEDLLHRVAGNIASIDAEYGKDKAAVNETAADFYQIMADGEFMPNSPTLMNAGRDLQQLSACFVLPLEDSMEGIFTALKNMALVQKTGGGTGFSFDRLRPSNDIVRSTNGVASGPLSFLKIFDAATEAVKQGGTRRGANMGSLIYNHPNILDFIVCKENEDEINNFNLSVTVSDQFMSKAIGEDPDPAYPLINPRTSEPYKNPETEEEEQLDAVKVFDLIVQKAWGKGDPGIIFIDRMNEFNPTPQVGKYETTNPCMPGDTFVLTADGPKVIRDLIGKSATLIINGKPYRTTAKGFFPTGVKKLLFVETKQGYSFRATGNHRILKLKNQEQHSNESEWVNTEDLQPGDKILLHNHRDFSGWNGLYGEEEGYLAGLLVSDETLVNEQALLSASPDQAAGIAANRGNLKRCSKLVAARIKKIAVSLGVTPQTRMITPFLETRTSSDFIKGFLKSFFDTAGSIHGPGAEQISISLTQNSAHKAQAIQRMLARFGIASSICAAGKAAEDGSLPGKDIDIAAGKSPIKQHQLVISGNSVAVFADRVGFSDKKNNHSLAPNLAAYRQKQTYEPFTAIVDRVCQGGTEEVYDVQVPGANAFDANGVIAHNCGEQPLLPYEACCLGSINLGHFVTDSYSVDWNKLERTVGLAVRFLDNVIDASNYVIPEIENMHRGGNRKIGLGIMGWHDMLVRLGITYDSDAAIETAENIMQFISKEAKKSSVQLAKERDVFPNFEGSIYDNGNDEDRVRNATRTTIAPTGTISILAGASSGIEPYFSIAYVRKNILGGLDLPEVNPLFLDIARREGFHSDELIKEIAKTGSIPENSAVPKLFKDLFKTAMEIDFDWHVRHQAVFQKYTDNAVSKTINLKQEATEDDVRNAYITAWKAGCKGITIYRDSSRTKQVLNVGDGEKELTLKPSKRPKTLSGQTTSIRTALGNLFVTVNSANGKPFELFAQIGKAGSDVVAFTEAIARLISLALRCGVSIDEIVTQLEGIGGARSVGFGANRIMSVPDAVGQALKQLAEESGNDIINHSSNRELCPDCGTCALIRAEGCLKCEACGFTEC